MAFALPAGIHFTSVADIDAFIDNAAAYPEIASAARELSIILTQPIPLLALRECLSIVPDLEDLVLFLPRCSPVDLLDNVHLPRLQLFKTNLPHQHLLQFLANHVHLTDLCLGACGRDTTSCPLQALDLAGVSVVECPVDCIPAVANRNLYRLTGDVWPRSTTNTPAILRSISVPLTSLSALTLNFYANDYDLLQSIVRVAPRLQKLKLLERPSVFRRQSHSRRAWNDAPSWAATLRRLEWLGELAVRTESSLTRSLQSADGEARVLMKWVVRSFRAVKKPARVVEHSCLTSLRVWYRTREAGGGVLTYWSKASGAWRNILRAVPPPPDTFF